MVIIAGTSYVNIYQCQAEDYIESLKFLCFTVTVKAVASD